MAVNLGTVFATLDADLKPLLRGIARAKQSLLTLQKGATKLSVGRTATQGINQQLAAAQSGVGRQQAGGPFGQGGPLNTGIKNFSTQFAQLRQQGTGVFSSLSQAAGGLTGVFGGLVAGAATFGVALGARSIVQFFASAVNAAQNLNSMRASMEAVTGSMAGGAQAMEFTRSVANRLGLELISTSRQYRNLLAATVAGGHSAEAAQFVFEGIAVGMRGLDLASQEAALGFRAISQIMSKGKVQAEELRGQLGEQLPVAIGFLSKALGKPPEVLNKLMQQGRLTSGVLLDLAAQMQKSLGQGAAQQAQNLRAEFTRLGNSTTEFLAKIGGGSGLNVLLRDSVVALKSLLLAAMELTPILNITLTPLALLVKVLSFLIRVISGAVLGFTAMVRASNQIVLGLGPVAKAIDVVIGAIKKIGEFGARVFKYVGGLVVKFANLVGKIIPDAVKETFDAGVEAFNSDGVKKTFDAGVEGFKKGFGGDSEAFVAKSTEELDKQLAELKKGFKGGGIIAPTIKASSAASSAAFDAERASVQAITEERNKQKSLIEQQNQLAQVRRDLADGERDTLSETLSNLGLQAEAKLRLLQFDRESLQLEIAKLQSIRGGGAANQAKIAADVASRQAKLEELAITEQIIRAESQLSLQKAQQAEAQKELKANAEFALESARIQSQIELETLKQEGAGRVEIDAARLATQQQLNALKQQQLQQEILLAEAQGRSTAELEREMLLLQQQQSLLGAEQTTFDMTPALEQARELSNILTQGIESFINGLTTGTLDLGKTFTNLGQNLIQNSVQPLFDQIQQSLQQTFTQIGGRLGGLGGALFGGILVGLGSLFNRQKSETQSLADEVRGNIESVETVRGLIAGEQGIAVQQLSDNLSIAFRPTNDILRLIDSHIVNLLTAFDVVATGSDRGIGAIDFSVLGGPRI